MTLVVLIGLLWLALTLPLGIVLGRAVRVADRRAVGTRASGAIVDRKPAARYTVRGRVSAV